MIYRLINPSDGIFFEGDDDRVAFVACVLLGRGRYALEKEDGEHACPLMLFASEAEFEECCKRAGVFPVGEYLSGHRTEVAAFLRTVLYTREKETIGLFNASVASLSEEARREARTRYNEERRSSSNNIGAVCLELAEALELIP